MALQAITKAEINDIIKRLRQLNDTMDQMAVSISHNINESAEKIKKKVEQELKEEVNFVSKWMQKRLTPVLSMASAQLAQYRQLMKVPKMINVKEDTDHKGKPIKCPYTYSYLTMVAGIEYAPVISQLTGIISSYSAAIAQINAEIARASSITLPSIPESKPVKAKTEKADSSAAKDARKAMKKPDPEEPDPEIEPWVEPT